MSHLSEGEGDGELFMEVEAGEGGHQVFGKRKRKRNGSRTSMLDIVS